MVPPPETSPLKAAPEFQTSSDPAAAGLLAFDRDLPELFHTVTLARPPDLDGKAIVDSVPLKDIAQISAEYFEASQNPDFDASSFFAANFRLPEYRIPKVDDVGKVSVAHYIGNMWDMLTQHNPRNEGTLIGTPNPNLKPGERFGEGCYWDLDLGIKGLLVEARHSEPSERRAKEQLAIGVADNLVRQIERFGYVPNGWRSYYLGRSQPPVFASIVDTLGKYFNDDEQPENEKLPSIVEDYLPYLTQEYEWWMGGNRAVTMPNGHVLNRHWDENDTPRPESRQEDIATAALAPDIDPKIIYRNIRAAAEMGKDFTARVLRDPYRLETIHTTDFISPELNSFLYQYETFLADVHKTAGRSVLAKDFSDRAKARAYSVNRYLWNKDESFYGDYDFVAGQLSPIKSMGMAYPVAVGMAPRHRAHEVAMVLERDMLQPGGFASSLVDSEQQWDKNGERINGWAPDQMKGIKASLTAGGEHTRTAYWAAFRWLKRNSEVHHNLGFLVEKIDVGRTKGQPGGGGEYPVQRGFLWTNGAYRVLRALVEGETSYI